MERDGVVRRAGKRPGLTRPSHLFELTPETEALLSKAYIPLLTRLLSVFTSALPTRQVERLLRQTGTALAKDLSRGKRLTGGLKSRAAAASEILNDQLGAVTHVEANGSIVIHGAACPLSALTDQHQGVCLALESLLTEIVGAPVRECCDRKERPRCCFEIQHGHKSRQRLRSNRP